MIPQKNGQIPSELSVSGFSWACIRRVTGFRQLARACCHGLLPFLGWGRAHFCVADTWFAAAWPFPWSSQHRTKSPQLVGGEGLVWGI